MRPSRPLHFMRHALLAAERSTCYRLNVGAIIVNYQSRTPVASGYNGALPGQPHCQGHLCPGALTSCERSIHAEQNAIDRCTFIPNLDYDLYVTHSPCARCCQLLYAKRSIVQRLFYGVEFRDIAPLEKLARVMEVYKVTPAGYVTRLGSPQLIDPETLYS